MFNRPLSAFLVILLSLAATAARGEGAASQPPPQPAQAEAGGAPAPLVIFFTAGSSKMQQASKTTLDRASRAFNEGKPIVMVLSANSDRTGDPQANLLLSQQRAIAVFQALIDRGIPADRFQILAKGETDLPVATAHGVAERDNRRVAITWR